VVVATVDFCNAFPMSLERFIHAQEGTYDGALAELKAGRKTGHWIWWIFPQQHGLGSSYNSDFYGLADAAEVQAYLQHPVLGPRFYECVREVYDQLFLTGRSPLELMGSEIDVVKMRSSLELFLQNIFVTSNIELFDSLPQMLERLLTEKLGWRRPLD
jgi:uncharacterized protein (DUF1810 family)